VIDAPQNRRMRERLEPVGQREARIGVLGLLKRLRGLAIFEVVKLRDAAKKRCLCRGDAGVREVNEADAALHVRMLCVEPNGESETKCGVRDGGAANLHGGSEA